jgi:transcriptional regulator with XRE-family HTH domain
MSIAEIVIKQRAAKGWTQNWLAYRAGVNRSSVVRIEQGGKKASVETVDKILAALGATFTIGGAK